MGNFSFKHLALFNGIGGFQLAADWMGWENVAHVEINDWCNKVVKQHFPNSKCYTDIKNFDGKEYAGTIDIISGGFPCQPFSVAGKQRGNSDDRYLWPEMLRVIREVQPSYVVGENVPGIITLALDKVLDEMESEGYSCQTFIIPASGVGAWHKRERIWIIASNTKYNGLNGSQNRQDNRKGNDNNQAGANSVKQFERCSLPEYIPDTNSERLSTFREPERLFKEKRETCSSTERRNLLGREWINGRWTTEPGICGVANGIPNRVDRIKGLGNAIVPQVAYEIFKAISNSFEKTEARGQKNI